MRKVLVTGGAGFLGGSMVRAMVGRGYSVTAVDILRRREARRISPLIDSGALVYADMDLSEQGNQNELSGLMKGVDTVMHFAAHSNVRTFDSRRDYKDNTKMTRNVMDAMISAKVSDIIFSSSSTVYGTVRSNVPETSESVPISFYGASKMTSESLVSSYVHMNHLNALILRFANIVGPDPTQGVIFDFIRKLKEDPDELEILGDGKQTKQYIHVDDITGWISGLRPDKGLGIYNVSTDGFTTVDEIADIVCEEMGLKNVRYRYTGGEGGWEGDIPSYGLEISKARSIGWTFTHDSTDAVRLAVRQMLGRQ
jgi:UDP-glucose 4-epimerase